MNDWILVSNCIFGSAGHLKNRLMPKSVCGGKVNLCNGTFGGIFIYLWRLAKGGDYQILLFLQPKI